ncbi:type I-E CRISPR-associated protein Cse2/CasB [Streptomyces sp. NPDC002067]
MPTEPQPDSAETTDRPRRLYWNAYVNGKGAWRTDPDTKKPKQPPGEHLAALRSGLGREAFTVPALWPFYVTETDGKVTRQLEAEHAALSLYGLHQQSQSTPMHAPRVAVGAALRALHKRPTKETDDGHKGYSAEAVDRRVAATVSATSVSAFVHRLRGLITQLRSVQQPLDYDALMRDIRSWHRPDGRARVRRAWGMAYHLRGARPGDTDEPGTTNQP